MSQHEKPTDQLSKVGSSASEKEFPQVYAIQRNGVGWQVSRHENKEAPRSATWHIERREFLAAAMGVAGVLAACGKKTSTEPTSAGTPPGPSAPSSSTEQVIETVDDSNAVTEEGGCATGVKAQSTGGVSALAFSPNGALLASGQGNSGGYIRLWDIPSGRLLGTLEASNAAVYALAFSPDGNLLASGAYDKTIKLWQMPTGTEVNGLPGDQGGNNALAFNPDGTLLCTGGERSTIGIWEIPSGNLVRQWDRLGGTKALAVSPDGVLVATGGDFFVTVNEIASGKESNKLHQNWVKALAFSPDGSLLVSGGGLIDGQIALWRMPSGDLVHELVGFPQVNAMAISPGGSYFVSGSADGIIRMWEMPSGKLSRKLAGHSGSVNSLTFSPDGYLLISGSADNTIKLWEMPSGKFATCLFDPSTLASSESLTTYSATNSAGQTITYTLPCGSAIPAGAICACNCVAGTATPPRSGSSGSSGSGSGGGGGGGHYWYPN